MKSLSLFAAALTLTALHAAPIPLEFDRPDGKPGDLTKPVKVYILAGQSNMVGMGDLKGAAPQYPFVYLSAEPAIIEGRMHAGTSRQRGACKWIWKGQPGLRKHGLYRDAEGQSPVAPTGTLKAGTTQYFIDVPNSGNYLVHVGYGDSSHATATVDGKEVYRKEAGGEASLTKITLEAGKRYPLEITYAKPGSAVLWLEQVDLEGKGDLVTLTRKDGKFPHLVDDENEWTVRQDVHFVEARVSKGKRFSPLSADSNGGSLGPEVGFGFVMGSFHDEPVLLIKTAMGNRSLKFDFQPPSSERTEPDNNYEGLEYRLMLEGVRDTLENIETFVPGYQGQGYELTGFCWFQGHKDRGSSKEEYEGHLVNLIQDLRKDLEAPDMKAVVATAGFGGYRINSGDWKGVWEAQMAVGDPEQHPNFEGNVASVDTRDFWRELEESPRNQDYHYHRNPEFYLLTGEAMGRAMVRLLGGEAQAMPKSDRKAKTLAAMKREAATPEPTEAEIAASEAACKPMILDGLLVEYLKQPRNQKKLEGAFAPSQPKPEKFPEYLEDPVDDIAAFFKEARIDTYEWKPVLPEMSTGNWDILAFDAEFNPYDAPAPGKGEKAKTAPVKFEIPADQKNWFAKDFDAKKAGWKTAPAPFGKTVPKEWPEKIEWVTTRYAQLYPAERPQPATVIENDVLLMRKTFDLPPAKEGHRYRVRIEGSINANSGEGFAIYANGKLMGERKSGVTAWRRQGKSGSHVWSGFMEDFKGGPLTLAVANFPMNNFKAGDDLPAIGPLSVIIEEQKIPDVTARP
ncbi:MAG: sialate O-acetylesterase [Akkermansiaceae bacterium]|nr:sialate O-acetylesterase [Akkermansiaceae bacterium]